MNSVTDTLRILLVEDNPGDARFLKIALEEELSERFEMIHETRLEEALQTLGEAEFDMVLLDLSLPDETGLETFRRIASVSTDTPIVVLTGLNDEETARKALQGGAQDYLVKGQFQRGSLLRAVRFSLERHKSRRNSLEHLEQWALQDSLTGLLNRRGLQKIFLEEIDSPDFDGSNFFALLVGLDNFKPLLDVFGRPAGEFILRECAQQLKASVPPGTPLGWLQGDEFLVLLPRTGADKAAALAEKMRASISGAPIPWSSETLRVSCSVGAVMVPETVSTLNELLNHAHFTLSQSKSGTKNKVSYSWGSQGEAPGGGCCAWGPEGCKGWGFRFSAVWISRCGRRGRAGPAGLYQAAASVSGAAMKAPPWPSATASRSVVYSTPARTGSAAPRSTRTALRPGRMDIGRAA